MQDIANNGANTASHTQRDASPARGYPVTQDDGRITFAMVRGLLWRQRLIIAGIVLATLIAGLVWTLLTTPMYQSSATVRVDTYENQIVAGQEVTDPYIHFSEISRYLETLATVIRSRHMAERVAGTLDPQTVERLIGEAPEGGVISDQLRQRIAARIMSGVSVEVPIDSRVIYIRYTSDKPEMASLLANAYAESFISEDLDRGIEANSYALTYLEGQITEMRNQLRDAEVSANQYARSNRLVGQPLAGSSEDSDSTGASAQTMTVANLVDINRTYTEVRAQRISAEQRWQAVSGIPANQLPEVQQNSSIQALRTQLAQLNGQLSDLRERYRDDYPDVRELLAQIASTESQIEQASAEIKNSIRNDYQIALRQESALGRELERVSNQTLDEQDRRVQFNLIDRDADAYRAQLATLLERYNEIAAASNLRSNNMTLLDRAITPGRHYSPNIMQNMLLALFFGIALAVAFAILREVFDDRLRSIEDIEGKLNIAGLGQTPFVADMLDEDFDDNFSPLSEAYSSIRATLDFAMPVSGHKVIQFTSSQESEGKTTTSVTLARKIASVGRKVLLVDMDLRRPSMSKMFETSRGASGVVDVLYSRVALKDALIDTGIENLDILPVGQIPSNPVEILSSGLVAEFFERYRGQYDVILVDSSPVMGIADSPLLSRFVDGVVFVVEANRAHRGQARSAIRRLRDMNANIIGGVLTKFRALEAGQNYNYQYSYYTYESKRD